MYPICLIYLYTVFTFFLEVVMRKFLAGIFIFPGALLGILGGMASLDGDPIGVVLALPGMILMGIGFLIRGRVKKSKA
jgi:hypothetical protein